MRKYFLFLIVFFLTPVVIFAQTEPSAVSSASIPTTSSVIASSQVNIEAKIVQITLDEEHHMGVDWAAIVSNYQSLDLKDALEFSKDADSTARLSFGTISNDDYTILLEALDTVGMMDVVATPSSLTAEGKSMTIAVDSLQPKLTTTVTTTFFGSKTVAEQLDIPDWGIQLLITPSVGENNEISFHIQPRVDSKGKKSNTSADVNKVTVKIQDGVVVIGGLIKEDKVRTIHKLPFFGDLPVVGVAFRNQNRSSHKVETVIFLTPKIMPDAPTDAPSQ